MGSKRRRKKSNAKSREGDRDKKTRRPPVTDSIREQIDSWAHEAARANDVLLFESQVNGAWVINVAIEKPDSRPGDGVTVDKCVKVSRYLEAILDASDAVPERYTVEVSSPGVERPITRKEQLTMVYGRPIRVVTREPIDGQNVYEGTLESFEDDILEIDAVREGHDTYRLDWDDVAKAKLIFEFSAE